MNESVLNFGPSSRLVGVLNRPPRSSDAPHRAVGILFVNAGIIHHVGPNRIHVRMSRRLAKEGWSCLRIDLPGVGDSRSLDSTDTIEESNLHGVREALDVFESRTGIDRVVVFGLCSGTREAAGIATMDDRVAGVVLIDPPTNLSTRWHRIRRVLTSVPSPRKWGRLLRGEYRNSALSLGRAVDGGGEPANENAIRAQAFEILETLLRREVRIFFMITGSRRAVYSYRNQFFAAFPELDLKRITHLEFAPDADHTFSVEADRALLLDRLRSWLARFDRASGEGDRNVSDPAIGSSRSSM